MLSSLNVMRWPLYDADRDSFGASLERLTELIETRLGLEMLLASVRRVERLGSTSLPMPLKMLRLAADAPVSGECEEWERATSRIGLRVRARVGRRAARSRSWTCARR